MSSSAVDVTYQPARSGGAVGVGRVLRILGPWLVTGSMRTPYGGKTPTQQPDALALWPLLHVRGQMGDRIRAQ